MPIITTPNGNEIELLGVMDGAEKIIERAGRTCYQSFDKIGANSAGDFIKKIIGRGHESVVEHSVATFRIIGSRAMTHQLVRHRLASYSQKSQRYVSEEQFDYIIPPDVLSDETKLQVFRNQMATIQAMYNCLRDSGLKKEDARFVLPNACSTEIVMTANFREWRHFFAKRCDSHAQWEIRGIATIILNILYELFPNCFTDYASEYLNIS